MKRGSVFFGIILIMVGGVFLLETMGLIANVNVWGLVLPTFLIIIGVGALLGSLRGTRSIEVEQVSLPLEGAERAKISVKFGAGRLRIGADAGSTELVEGSFSGGLEHLLKREGDTLIVDMRLPSSGFPDVFMPWNWGRWAGFEWIFGLNDTIPLALRVETGASDASLDLIDLRVTDLRLETGASSTEVTLPAKAGFTSADIDAGAANVRIKIPSGVAARIKAGGALVGINVDTNRFPREGGVYQSPDYDTAENKVSVSIEVGAGSITVQ